MGRYYMKSSGSSPVCHRNSRISRAGDTGTDARNDLYLDSLLSEKQGFFAASSEYKRISAFQSHHNLMFHGFLSQKPVDFFLLHHMVTILFSHVNLFTILFDIVQKAGICQPVINYTICMVQYFHAFYGDQIRISRTGSCQKYRARHFFPDDCGCMFCQCFWIVSCRRFIYNPAAILCARHSIKPISPVFLSHTGGSGGNMASSTHSFQELSFC